MRAKIFLPLLLTAALAQAAQFKFGNQTFTVPDGFTVERVAGPPLVNRPIEASFDEQGRLYVTDSSSTPSINPGFEEGIRVGSARDGRVTLFIEDPHEDGTQEGVFADRNGNIYGSLTAGMALRRYTPR